MRVALMLFLLTVPYTDAWAPDTEAAAEAAVARLGEKRAVEIVPEIVNIVGLEAEAVSGNISDLRQAMSALGAQETATEINVQLPADVLFDFDKAAIRPDAAQALANLATIIRANPNAVTRLEGHTDAVGDDRYNQALSERRAESVKQWLVANQHLDASKLVTKGWGKTKPVASNDTPEGRQKNRRLEAIVEKK